MPLYSFQCIYCNHEFDEIKKFENSGKSICPKCGNTSFKIPAIFSPKIFKPRSFADGTSTPEFVTTHKKEKEWLKAQGITYDKPNVSKTQLSKERKKQNETVMENAFANAMKKVNQGLKLKEVRKNGKLEAVVG